MKKTVCFILLIFSFSSCKLFKHGTDGKHAGKTSVIYTPGHLPVLGPYAYLNQGRPEKKNINDSPDPLINYRWTEPAADSNLQIYYLRPVAIAADKPASFENIKSATSKNCNILIRDSGSLLVDFGVESAAWLEFDSPDLNGDVTLSISEYKLPAIVNAGPKHPKKTAVPVKHGNTYRLELNKDLYEGVRFGWIHINSLNKPWHISNIRLVCQVKPTNYTGSFSCSDEMMTRMWYTGAYAVKLNLLKDYFGAILMDRGDRHSWTGDAHTSQAAALVAFSNYGAIKHNIKRTSIDNNAIESYSLYWILSLIDYFNYTGDKAFLISCSDIIGKKISHSERIYGKNPGLGFYGWDERLGAGFENPDNPESQQAYKMLFIQTCNTLAAAMKSAGQLALETKYRQLAKGKITELRQNKNWFSSFGIHAIADAVNGNFLSEQEKKAIIQQSFQNRINNVSFSPFNQYFIIKSMSQLGLYPEAFTSIDDCWGGQLRLGATTFWETYRPGWNKVIKPNEAVPNGQCGYTSLCHPWSSGITKWLSEEVLGIKPAAPGFRKYEVIPHLGSKLTWVKGNVKTPAGDLKAELNIESGTGYLESPVGTTGVFAIPKERGAINIIRINNRVAWKKDQFSAVPGIGSAREDSAFVYLHDIEPGQYQISFSYNLKPKPLMPPKKYTYLLPVVKVDSTTGGNWGYKYGQNGYMLFDAGKENKHVSKLPANIHAITWQINGPGSPGIANWLAEITPAVLNKAVMNDRKFAALKTQNPNACFQTFYVDILAKGTEEYECALFFADGDKSERLFLVELFDYDTKSIIAPAAVIENPGKGKYLNFKYNQSVRVRLSHIRGSDANLNGIFFQ